MIIRSTSPTDDLPVSGLDKTSTAGLHSSEWWPLRLDGLLLAMVVIGAGLRLWQYIANPSLYLDEVAVARNILERPLWELLTTPLAYDQVAPKGFLLLEKLAVVAFGSSDYVLRLVPLVSALTALIAFWRVVTLVLDDVAAIIAIALFVTAAPLLAFTSLVKQYSTDVAVAMLLLWIALELQSRPISSRRAWWAGLAGAAAVWLSQSAIITLVALGAVLTVVGWQDGGTRRLRALAPTLVVWASQRCWRLTRGWRA